MSLDLANTFRRPSEGYGRPTLSHSKQERCRSASKKDAESGKTAESLEMAEMPIETAEGLTETVFGSDGRNRTLPRHDC